MSRSSTIEEAFTRMLISESIFAHNSITASLASMPPMKDLRDRYVFEPDFDDSPFLDDPSNRLERSLSVGGYFGGKKRICKPGKPGRKLKRGKSVTFADTRGGDLVQVREFDNNIDPIQNCLSDPVRQNSEACSPHFVLLFTQPCANYGAFMRQLFTQKVCLESARIISGDVLIGTAKVQNLAFEKQVDIRVTMDSWKTCHDVRAKFLHSESGNMDVFTFKVQIPPDVEGVKFCVRYSCNGSEFWDSNDGANYCITAKHRHTYDYNYRNKR